ncbi:hypothetical protein [Baekduia sp. Peel2402]|uniref:hypothetical protein n=1 Tax=Baekduia sp. Peel2402 TaxID=3458296 RepID=UPI00403E74FB
MARMLRTAMALGALMALPTSAGALTLGTTQRPTAFPSLRCDQPKWGVPHVYYQPVSLPSLPSSRAPSGGSITSWSTQQFGAGDPGGTIALAIVHPTEAGITVTAYDTQLLPATIGRDDLVFTPTRPVPIAGGDFIGIWGPDDHSGCMYSGGEQTEAVAFGPMPTLASGASTTVKQMSWNRADVAAEMGGPLPEDPKPPAPDPTPTPTTPTAPGAPIAGAAPPAVPPIPTFRPDGRPLVSVGKGGDVTVDTGQNVGCSTPGPCIVISTAVTYYGTGGVEAARVAAKAKPKRKKVTVGTRRFTVPAGGNADVTLKLNATGRKAFKKAGKLKLSITTTIKQAGAKDVVKARSITIKAPKKKK